MSEADARRSFPELANVPLVQVSHIVNLDQEALTAFADASQDFVILNHVIEHVANPIRVIVECFRVLRDGGKLVMSAPDMRFSFDRDRALTTPEHLWAEYETGVNTVTDDHYIEFINIVHAEAARHATKEEFERGLAEARERREHAHVWNSDTFRALQQAVVQRHHIEAHLLVESLGDDNASEYFSIWQKGTLPHSCAPVRFNPAHTDVAFHHVLHMAKSAQQAQNEQNALLQAETQNLQADRQQLQTELTRSQHTQQCLSQALAGITLENQALRRELENLKLTIADKDRHIHNIESQLSLTTQEVREHQYTIKAIRSSRSWRWTAWLRR